LLRTDIPDHFFSYISPVIAPTIVNVGEHTGSLCVIQHLGGHHVIVFFAVYRYFTGEAIQYNIYRTLHIGIEVVSICQWRENVWHSLSRPLVTGKTSTIVYIFP